MESTFREQVLSRKQSDAKSLFLTKDEYFSLIEEVKDALEAEKKTFRQYYALGRYEILQCGDIEKLIKKRKSESVVRYFTHVDEMFDIIKRAHISTGHGGRDKMAKALDKYANVTREAIELFKSLCMECQKKRKRVITKGVVVKPIISKDYLSRGQVDLVDISQWQVDHISGSWCTKITLLNSGFCVPLAPNVHAKLHFNLWISSCFMVHQPDAGEPFVIINDGDADKILGMTTTANLEHLCAADIIYGDGTFYVSPTVFLQLYTINAMVGNQMFPLVFFLLPNKTADTYTRAFRLLKNAAAERGLVLEPRLVQMDYEAAAKNAVSTVFPNAEWKGCLFHFTQCIWRKAQETGLQSDYNQNINQNIGITRLVRHAAALPSLPVNEVEDVWMDTIGDMLDDPRCHRFADCVTTFWVEGDLPLRSWNHYETTGPRTNNHLEAWHGCLKRIISKAHPKVFEMLSFLKDEQKLNEIRIIQYGAGQQQTPKKRKYVTMKTKLGNLKANLQAGVLSSLEYTDAVSHLLKVK